MYKVIGVRAQSTLGEDIFCQKIGLYVRKINKIRELYLNVIFAGKSKKKYITFGRKRPIFFMIIARKYFPDFSGWGARAPLAPVSYVYV